MLCLLSLYSKLISLCLRCTKARGVLGSVRRWQQPRVSWECHRKALRSPEDLLVGIPISDMGFLQEDRTQQR